jgi:hypothetical protein
MLFLLATGCTLVCANDHKSCPIGGASTAFSDDHECHADSQCPDGTACVGGTCRSSNRE